MPWVLQLLASGGTGGAQESAIALLLHLDRSRFEVEAVSLTDGLTVKRLRELGIRVTVIPPRDDESTVRELVAYLRAEWGQNRGGGSTATVPAGSPAAR